MYCRDSYLQLGYRVETLRGEVERQGSSGYLSSIYLGEGKELFIPTAVTLHYCVASSSYCILFNKNELDECLADQIVLF